MAAQLAGSDPRAAPVWALIRGMFEAFAQRREDGVEGARRAQLAARAALQLDFAGAMRDVAIARYLVHFEYQPPNATAGHVRITDVLVERDGRWRIVHHHEGMRPVGPPPLGPPHPDA